MKSKKAFAPIFMLMISLLLAACSNSPEPGAIPMPPSTGRVYLCGEEHGVETILNKELELWGERYHNENMRHLFIEYPYYTAELLNIWMQSDSDEILDAIYDDWVGSAAHNPSIKEFFQNIKSEFPETVFHGTDVGHQHNTIGRSYLKYLETNGLKHSEQYLLAEEAIAQGKRYYSGGNDYVYRENMMAENFIREFDKLCGENIMGIYGAAHTGLDAKNHTYSVPCMANQLKERYGGNVFSEDLTLTLKDIAPSRIDAITMGEKEYTALYYGKQDISSLGGYAYREFWRVENAYDDFKDRPKTGGVLPYHNYPMLIETGQIFAVDYTAIDGAVVRMYYRSNGNDWEGMPATEQFTIE